MDSETQALPLEHGTGGRCSWSVGSLSCSGWQAPHRPHPSVISLCHTDADGVPGRGLSCVQAVIGRLRLPLRHLIDRPRIAASICLLHSARDLPSSHRAPVRQVLRQHCASIKLWTDRWTQLPPCSDPAGQRGYWPSPASHGVRFGLAAARPSRRRRRRRRGDRLPLLLAQESGSASLPLRPRQALPQLSCR